MSVSSDPEEPANARSRQEGRMAQEAQMSPGLRESQEATVSAEIGTNEADRPRRTIVTGPRMVPSAEEALLMPSGSRPRPAQAHSEVDSLRKAQLRLAFVLAGLFIAVLAGAFLILALSEPTAERKLLGIPLGWLIPGVAFYPLMLVAAWVYMRRTARYEQQYRESTAGTAS